MPIDFALVLHAHQPAGNFNSVIEATYQSSYRPFVEAVAARPDLRLNLHYSGYLLDWIGAHHPEHIELLRSLVAAGRLEILGGGYYEPIWPAISPLDRLEQIRRLGARVEHYFGSKPRGAWLAERVWEPDLPATLARAGLDYTLVDDFHFLLAGFEAEQLRGYFLTEQQGEVTRIFPCNHFLRLAIPFRPIKESFHYLREAAARPGALLTMGDDLEKFGSWPKTHEHVYDQGWLEHFLDGLEERREEIRTVRLSDYLAGHPPVGLAYLPAASYPEMMQWALPYAAAMRNRVATAAEAEHGHHTLHAGAHWRAFLVKYREANLLHKTQQDLSRRLHEWRRTHTASAGSGPGNSSRHLFERAWGELLAGQANDAYWHGWFGGLYAPHLRNEIQRHLIAADVLLEELAGAEPCRRLDLDCDGREEVELRSDSARVLITPGDGGVVAQLDYRPAAANLINSLQRRPEVYHEDIRRQARVNPAGLPGEAAAALPELEKDLLYDLYPRGCGRLYRFAPGKQFEDFARLRLGEDPEAAGGPYAIVGAGPGRVELKRAGIRKVYRLTDAVPGVKLELEVEMTEPAEGAAALECNFNLLSENAPDRGIICAGERFGLGWAGVLPPAPVTLEDGFRRLRIILSAPGAVHWWVEPIHTVSQSETGFERVYQGSAIAAVWPAGTRRPALAIEIVPYPE